MVRNESNERRMVRMSVFVCTHIHMFMAVNSLSSMV